MFFVLADAAVHGLYLPFKVLSVPPGKSLFNSRLLATVPYGFQNLQDNVYAAQLYVAGQNFTVQLDTGSSDLWIDPSIAGVFSLPDGTVDTGVQSSICYIDTTCAQGPITTSNVTLGNFTVPEQAYRGPAVNAVGSNATYAGMNGLLGLGSTLASASSIMLDLGENQNVNGHTLMYNILETYPSIGNFMSFLLSRTETGTSEGGTFTIGDIASGMDSISQTPQLPVLLDTRWAIAINGMIINGVAMIAPSSTGDSNLAAGQLMANFDTGTARAAAPPLFVDAMYKDMPGAEFDGVSKYTLPCNNMVTVSIAIGNLTFPIHPIDVVVLADQGENSRTDGSDFICVGAFSYLEQGSSDIDVILGDTFLRNVYTIYNFGNWTRELDDPPSIQILSTTNESEASAEYASLNAARLAAKQGLQAQSHINGALLHTAFNPCSRTRTFLFTTAICILTYLL
ncbi:hypothetical protein NM688_g7840 [Phlebia brevispora]|uniref:Uncharacterized protein n=1 Tax=Phlebia brevispora TaxID=194682 RepID=A0ACC1S0L0_9APHY|nr:hypothetical protein NM688_g7840 [Phlebia brevispora]